MQTAAQIGAQVGKQPLAVAHVCAARYWLKQRLPSSTDFVIISQEGVAPLKKTNESQNDFERVPLAHEDG